MIQKINIRAFGKISLGKAALLALVLSSLATTSPHAEVAGAGTDIPVYDQAVDTSVNKVTSALNSALSNGQGLQSQSASNNTDALSTNLNRNIAGTVGAQQAALHTIPKNFCPCYVAQSMADASNNNQAVSALAQALAISQGARMESPSLRAQEIKEQCILFAPSDKNDPQYSSYQALCNGIGGASSTWAGADRVMESLLGPLEYNVAPNTIANGNNPNLEAGVYKIPPLTAPPGNQYYPFLAALTYCQHVTIPMPPPSQAPSSGGTPKGTVGLTSVSPFADARAASGAASDACYHFLAERMQFDSTVNIGPTTTPSTKTHDLQVTRCADDFAANLIDTAANTACQTNGRSALQADHDRAYRLTSADFQANVLSTLSWDEYEEQVSQAMHDQDAFEQRLALERQAMIQAIGAANAVPLPHSSSPVLAQ